MQTVKHLLVCMSLKAAAQFVSSCPRRVRPTEQTQRLTVLTAFSPFFPLRRWTALWLWSWSMRSTGRSGSLWSFTTLPPRSSHLQHSRSLLPHLLPRRRLLLLLCLHRWRREAEQWWWKVSRFTDYHQCIYVWKCTDTKTVLSDISNVWSLTWDLTWRRNRRSAAERRREAKTTEEELVNVSSPTACSLISSQEEESLWWTETRSVIVLGCSSWCEASAAPRRLFSFSLSSSHSQIFNSSTFRKTTLCKGSYYCRSKLFCSGYFTFLVLFIPPYTEPAERIRTSEFCCVTQISGLEKKSQLFFFFPFCCCCCCFKDVLILFCTKHPWQPTARCQT